MADFWNGWEADGFSSGDLVVRSGPADDRAALEPPPPEIDDVTVGLFAFLLSRPMLLHVWASSASGLFLASSYNKTNTTPVEKTTRSAIGDMSA